ncbi:hypothetical protein P280DRAFT_471713 [Massarina eburnea CBS 473.64]|uniref:Uncharacterized protein n=1 Tax=Massarina eburnea CBS 473.64 TaxID=1395130 RepID=A0A6A6RRH4_9PLEO|nr:hypothetical protein P280DRAFT_471713 [Massarina eburnea CBS 473.64]
MEHHHHYQHGCSDSKRTTQKQERGSYKESGQDGGSSGEDYAPNNHVPPQHPSTQFNGFSCSTLPRQQHQYNDSQSHYYAVPRCWQHENVVTHQAMNSPALDRPRVAPSPNPHSSHDDSPMSQNSTHYTHQSHSSQGEAGYASRPQLTFSQLEERDGRRASTNTLDMWRRERQQDGPWDNVGYVNTSRRTDEHWRGSGY